MTEFIFDTNALLYVITTKNYQRLNINCHILDLTFYEYGNAVLNILAKRKTDRSIMSKDDTYLLMRSFQEVTKMISILRLEDETIQPILELAEREKLTFYDASYLYCALHFKHRLVTGDKKLLRAAENVGIDVMETTKWIEK